MVNVGGRGSGSSRIFFDSSLVISYLLMESLDFGHSCPNFASCCA